VRSNFIKQNGVSFIVGFLFAIGLAISGMTQPQKVIGFLNPWAWDPTLLFVMLGAVAVHALSYPLIRRRASPLLDTKWYVPNRTDLSTRLVLGSAVFGVGWGIGGYCPGPGLTSLSSLAMGDARPVVFVAAMIVGMLLFKKTEPYLRLRE
jgi:uncharacterized membrane protein YedE/YeeE